MNPDEPAVVRAAVFASLAPPLLLAAFFVADALRSGAATSLDILFGAPAVFVMALLVAAFHTALLGLPL